MTQPRKTRMRHENPGEARYLTFSCFNRLALFNNDTIKDLFAEQISIVKSKLSFELHAWVIMPEHVHLLITPDVRQANVSDILLALKRPFATRVLKRWRELNAGILPRITDSSGQSHFWQVGGGHDRNIDHSKELITKIDYTHENPIRRELVKLATEWKWSSAQWYEGEREWGPAIDMPLI